ncbi:MAG: hypothetical protein GF329_15935 [Candidatus Lokiarchaeota archaeon]|nr:hypothetical protein [Candidatus Lokiarchaeota archaeon]
MINKRAREGFFVETKEKLIFDVKGNVHPPNRIISYLRYFPKKTGDRKRNKENYEKVYSLDERTAIISRNYPQYQFYDANFGLTLQGVSIVNLYKIHDPVKFRLNLSEKNTISSLKKNALDLTNILIDELGINENKIGITGSPMVDLAKRGSDIDLVIYGSNNVKKTREGLKNLFEEDNEIKRYNKKGLRTLYQFKSNDMNISWEDFIQIEPRKIFEGTFRNIDFYIRGVKDWNEIEHFYGDFRIKKFYNATIEGTIENSDESLYTPCIYKIKNSRILQSNIDPINIDEVFSYRGRFCELLRAGEEFKAHGKIEKVILKSGESYNRLIIGGNKYDFLKLKKGE